MKPKPEDHEPELRCSNYILEHNAHTEFSAPVSEGGGTVPLINFIWSNTSQERTAQKDQVA